MGVLDGSAGKESACNAEDMGLLPGSGRSPGEGNAYPLQYSCLGEEESVWLQSLWLQRIRHDWMNEHAHTEVAPYPNGVCCPVLDDDTVPGPCAPGVKIETSIWSL